MEWGGDGVRGSGGGVGVRGVWGACEDLVGLSMYDGMIETVKYIWVNI